MADESPFIEEGTEKTTDEQAPDNLLEELKAAGVTNTEQLQNKLKASAEVGNLAFKLGETRKENEALAQRIEAMESKPVTEETEYGQPVDLQGEIRQGIRAERKAEREEAAKMQQAQMAAWNTIQNDEDFHLIKPIWDEKLKDPNFVYGVQSGQINPLGEYQQTLRTYYKGMMQKSAETIEKMQGGKVTTPVTETGHADAQVLTSSTDDDANERALESFKNKIETGGQLTEAEELAALQASFLK